MFKITISLLFIIFTFGCTTNSASLVKTPVEKKCLLKENTGKCRAYFKRYFFNQDIKKCEEFIWGGCGGSVPFNSVDTCRKACED